MKLCALVSIAILAGISLITPAFANIINIAFVPVGDINNPNDPATRSNYGAVDHAYKIAKNETTITQYAKFLNAVAKTDRYGLYNRRMTTSYINGISRSGVYGSYIYTVKVGSGNRPITYVSWFDAARFCNWLHNGQKTGADGALSLEMGAYTLNGATSGIIRKSAAAKFWIPSENEWHKAAYYDPNKGGAGVGGYWVFPTKSDTLAGNTIGVAHSANFYDWDYVGYPVTALTNVGAYGLNSQSAYGTNDQAGNVYEWNDAVISGSSHGLRGGSWNSGYAYSFSLRSDGRSNGVPTRETFGIGFRVARVP